MTKLKVVNLGTPARASYAVMFNDSTDEATASVSKHCIKTLYQMIAMGSSNGLDKLDQFEVLLGNQLLVFKNGPEVYDQIVGHDMTFRQFAEEAMELLENPTKKEDRAKKHKLSSSDIRFFNTAIARSVCKLAPPSDSGELTDDMIEMGLDSVLDLLESLDKKLIKDLAKSIAIRGGLDSKTNKIRFKRE